MTKSKSPMLTPPLVSSASQAATPPLMAPAMASSSSAARPRSTALGPGWRTQGQQGAPVRVPDLAGRRARRRPSTSSSPVDSTPTRARRARPPFVRPMLASTPRWPGPSTSRPGRPPRRRRCRRPPAARASPALGRLADEHRATRRRPASVSSTMTTASAPAGKGAPGHDPHRLARTRPRRSGAAPAARVPITGAHRVVWRGPGRVGGPHRVAVHGGVGERAARPRSATIALDGHAAEGSRRAASCRAGSGGQAPST